MPDLAFAQSGATNDALKNFAEIAATLVHVITAIAMIMVQFFPAIWGSELITGDQVTEMLRPMWIYIRNLTNIAFVGMILFLAFSNLVTSGKGIKDWNIKSKLGPVILGLVAINFSLLAMRVLVDVVHVGTVALLSIADPIIETRGVNDISDYYARSVDTKTFEPCDAAGGSSTCKSIRDITNNTFCASDDACLFKIKEISAIKAEAEKMNSPEKKNIMLGFATFFMKLESLPLLSADTGGLLDVLDSTIFSLIFGVAYLLALMAMFVVLLVRVVMMWLFIIFSPILVTSWVFGFNIPMISDNFWKYLLVPVKAAGALAFGFVMISALETMTIPVEYYTSVIEPGASLKNLWGPDEFGGWRMLWKVLTVVLFWKVVFDFALKDIEGVSGIVGGIKNFGEKAGQAGLTMAADNVPIGIPGVGGEGMTLASLMGSGSINNRLSQARQRMITTPGAPGNPFSGGAEARVQTDRMNNVLRLNPSDMRTLGREFKNRDGGMTAQQFDDGFNVNPAEMRAKLNAVPGLADKLTSLGYDRDRATPAQYREAIEKGAGAAVFTAAAPAPAATPTTPPVELDSAGVQSAVSAGISDGLSEIDFKAAINSQLAARTDGERTTLKADDAGLNALATSLAAKNTNVDQAEILAYLKAQLG